MTITSETTIQRFIGVSTDNKPTAPVGSFFWEYDTKLMYKCYDGTNWSVYSNAEALGTQIFTSSAATTTTITCAALADVANEYVGQQVLPLQGAMAGEGRFVTAYNGTNQLTVSPAWASDPDAAGNIQFAVVPGGLGNLTVALGTNGTTVTDSATTVLGAIGANNADNAFASGSVVANADGSVLEREEYIQANMALAASVATAAELTKVPKSDSTVTWNATALASVNAEVDTALNTIVPASPTAGSLNDALSKAAGGNTFNKATDSLEALADAVALIPTTAMRGTDSAALASVLGALNTAAAAGAVTDADEVMAYVKQLVTQLLASDANVTLIKTQTDKIADKLLFSMDFWSAPQEEVAIPAVGAAATLTLPTVTIVDLPAGATIVRAIAMLKCRMIENTNVAANKLSGATVADTSQVIQVRDDTPGTWRDAIKFADDQFGMAASTREGGDVLIGDTDIAVEVDANDGYNFQYLLAAADVAALNLNDVAVGLRIWYSV